METFMIPNCSVEIDRSGSRNSRWDETFCLDHLPLQYLCSYLFSI
jgi:hypothetical protein